MKTRSYLKSFFCREGGKTVSDKSLRINSSRLPVFPATYLIATFKISSSHIIMPVLLLFMFFNTVFSQEIPQGIEEQLENLAEQQQAISEDDNQLLQLAQFRKEPLNLNTANKNELFALGFLNDLQIENLVGYRQLMGMLIDIHELQAVPGWNITTIRQLLPFITIVSPLSLKDQAQKRFRNGEHQVLFRVSQEFDETSKPEIEKYKGSAQHLYLRYRYHYKNLLQYGIVADKDAGEQFLRGVQRMGFDFYSFHFFWKKTKRIQAIAIGDFVVNMGQGLIHWQGLAFGKSADAMNIKRQAPVLRPYNSAGEFNFHRGAGITMGKGKWEATIFLSWRKLSASLTVDSIQHTLSVSSLPQSGYHRTEAELAGRNKLHQLAVGGNINYSNGRFHVGVNSIAHRFSMPLQKSNEPYNLFAIKGKDWFNGSIDYQYTFRNLHLFGEAAIDRNQHRAIVNGLLVSMDSKIDASVFCRFISKQYQSVSGNAFTENTLPSNEKGIYTAITVRPSAAWRIDMYADIYSFPWLKYRVDAPSIGKDFLMQVSYKPDRRMEIYTRFRNKGKQLDQPGNDFYSPAITFSSKQNWRIHLGYKISPAIEVRSRVEMNWYDADITRNDNNIEKQSGFLTFIDFIHKPMSKKLSWILRMQYFETNGHDSGVYAYENDVLYSYSVPVFFDKGYYAYVIINFDLNQHLSCWIKWSYTTATHITDSGYGSGDGKSTLKLQLRIIL